MRPILKLCALTALLLTGAIFGFFYAWVCSTMWGLDATDPRVAIAAMQAMNASVRNAVFAPAFFATPLVLGLTSILALRVADRIAAGAFGGAALIYLTGGLILTLAVNVPMNEALAAITIPEDMSDAAEVWAAYSGRWQGFNVARTVASGLALLLAAVGLMRLGVTNSRLDAPASG